MAEYTITFKTRAELEGAKQALAALERQIGAAKAAGEPFDQLTAKARRMQEAIKGSTVEGSGGGLLKQIASHVPGLERASSLLEGLAGGILPKVAGGLAAIGAALGVIKEGLAEYAQAEERVAGLDAALAQSGQLTDQYRERLQELAGQMQATTGVADDQWLEVLTRLTQFGANPDNIEKYAGAVKNLAGLMGGDVRQAAEVVSRALQGQYDLFARYGIRVNEDNSQTEKLEKLFQELAQRGGGQLEARANTLSGQFQTLKNNTSDLFEAIGRTVAGSGVLQASLYGLSETAKFFAGILGGPIEKLEGLKNAAESSVPSLQSAEQAARQYASAQEEVAKQANEAAEALQKELTQLEKQQRQMDEQADAQMAVEIAKVEADPTISQPDKLQRKAQIRRTYAQAKDARDEQVYQKERERVTGEIEQQKRLAVEAQEEADKTKKLVSQVQEHTNVKRVVGTHKDEVDQAKKDLEALEKRLEDIKTKPVSYSIPEIKDLQERIPLFRARYEAAKTKQADLEAREHQLRMELPPGAPATPAEAEQLAKQANQASIKQTQESAKRINELTEKVDALDSDRTQRRVVFGFKEQAQQITENRAYYTARDQYRKERDDKIQKDVEASVKENRPVTPETLSLINEKETEQSLEKPLPKRAPRYVFPPQRLRVPTAQESELAAGAAASAWMMEQQSDAQYAGWRQQSRGVEARHAPARSGGQEIETIGAQIVQELTQNTDITVRNFKAFQTLLAEQNSRLNTVEHELRTEQSRARVRQ